MKKKYLLLGMLSFFCLMTIACDLLQEKKIEKILIAGKRPQWIIKSDDPRMIISATKNLNLSLINKLRVEEFDYFLVEVPDELNLSKEDFLEQLREGGSVEWIELNQEVSFNEPIPPFNSFPVHYQTIQCWSDISNLAESLSLYGVGSHLAQMAFVDTGFDTNHIEFDNSAAFKGYSIVKRDFYLSDTLVQETITHSVDGKSYELPVYEAMGQDVEWDANPGEGHGSHVAGIMAGSKKILGVCPENRVVTGYKIFAFDKRGFSVKGSAKVFDIFSTLVHIHLNRKNPNTVVVNFSLGFEEPSFFSMEMVNFAYRHKILLMASSGNDGYITANFPAHYCGVMGIGATDGRGKIAFFSSGSPTLSVVALGENVYSVKASLADNEYRYMSGTSMSCPFVVGMAGLLLTFAPTLMPGELRTVIEDTAKRNDSLKWDSRYGYGVVDVKAAVERVKRHQARLDGDPNSLPSDLIQSRYSDQIVEIGVLPQNPKGVGSPVFLMKKGGVSSEASNYLYYGFSTVNKDFKVLFSGLPYGEYRANLEGKIIDFALTASGVDPSVLVLK